MLNLRTIHGTGSARRLHRPLGTVGWIRPQVGQKTIGPMYGVRYLRRYRLMQRNRPRMTLNRVVLLFPLSLQLLSLQLFALALLTLSVGHLFLTLPFDQFALSRV